MKIYSQYKGETSINEETQTDFIRRTEGAGYYKRGTALQVLKDTGKLQTNFAYYFTEDFKHEFELCNTQP